MRILINQRGFVPLVVIVTLMAVAAFGGAGLVLMLSGSAKIGLFLFLTGVVVGLLVLPNMKKIIRWVKDVKKEF